MTEKERFVMYASNIVSAYVSSNKIKPEQLLNLIRHVHASIVGLKDEFCNNLVSRPRSNIEVTTSLGEDHLISFIDGKPYKSLKRHLTAHGLTPERYRLRYGLSADYPMVSPGYAAVRSRISKQIQFGLKEV